MNTPSILSVFALDESVLLPGGVTRLDADEAGLEAARALLASGDRRAFAVLRRETGGDAVDVHPVGSVVRLEGLTRDGGVVVAAVSRGRVLELLEGEPLRARVDQLAEPAASGTRLEALAHEARRLAREILEMLPGVPREVVASLDSIGEPGLLADTLANRVPADAAEKQAVLETLEVEPRLERVIALLARRREQLSVSRDIEHAVHDSVGRAEREHLLRRRKEAIEAELGEGASAQEDEADALEEKLAALTLPAEVRTQVDRELARWRQLPDASPERSVARAWLGLVADLPWNTTTPDDLGVVNAQATLDAAHHGLEKVKRRVLQFLAVRALRKDLRGPILCLVGAPGVGKTSLGQSIATALGRRLVRVSLGGVRDEAEIRGHRRTYVGAMPGRLVQALRRAGSMNPVIVLDELDKLGRGALGDPAAALLEVLDPEQNHAFVDHYLDVPVDLSRALFIATANSLDGIPAALRDRLEVLELPSYTAAEKVAIAHDHLLPRQLAAHGLAGARIALTGAALARLASGWTREAGVRSLEKRLADVCRALAVEKATGRLVEPRTVEDAELETWLGPARFEDEPRAERLEPGVATGLAWTPVGGETLTIESLRMPGKGKLILSGQLGEVMRESAQTALSWVQAHAAGLGLPERPLDGWDVHVHVPAGATPKDGPSAGVTLLTALVSLFTGVPVRGDVALTGEVTLRGRVLPVGGIAEKVLAAHRAGLRRVVLPRSVAAELRALPPEVRNDLDVVLVDRVDEVLDAALLRPAPEPLRAAA